MGLLRAREIRRLTPSLPKLPKFKNETQRVAHSAVVDEIRNGEMQLIEVACPLCGSQEFDHVASVDRQGLPVQTVRCLRCPTLYSRWRLSDSALERFYSSYYRDLYVGESSPSQKWFDSQIESGRKILKSLLSAKAIPDRLDGFRVIEVGSAAGGGLVPFRDAGAAVLGIDFDASYLEFGRSMGVDLQRGGVNDLCDFGLQDIVILKDVLEHIPSPIHSLELIQSVLSDRGVVYIQVPGLQALKFLGYRNDLLRYLQIAHLCHYTIESLEYSCQRAGLRVLHSELRGVVICSKASPGFNATKADLPSPIHAVDALEDIYRRRRITAIDHWLRSRIPLRPKQFLKALIR